MRQDECDRNKADIHHNQRWLKRHIGRTEFANVLPFKHRETRMGSQAVMQLVVSDIHRQDCCGLFFEQDMRKAAS